MLDFFLPFPRPNFKLTMFQNVFGRGKKKKEDKKPKKVKDNNNNNLATSTDAVEPTIEDGRAFKLVGEFLFTLNDYYVKLTPPPGCYG